MSRYGSEGARYVVVEIPGRVLSELGRGDRLLSRVRLFRSPRATALMQELRRSNGSGSRATGGGIADLLLELLGGVLPRADQRAGTPRRVSSAPAWLQEVFRRVSTEFADRPSVSELAADAGVHPDHVSRSFRHHFGFTLTDLVRRRRVEHAAEAIRRTPRALARIAYDAGFSDQSHMTRQVKRYLGVTPRQLRRLGRRAG